MEKILILGAGNAQIDSILYCKQHGWNVYGCSYSDTDKGISLLDHFYQIDIKDIEKITDLVRKEKIDIIYSVGSDFAMPSAMRVSELTGKPHFISYETARICHNKHELRHYLGNDFPGNIPYIEASSLKEALNYTSFPAMMKPVDSQGQRGCYKVNSAEDIRRFFSKSLYYSTIKKVILEKYIDGPEVSVNTYSVNGNLHFFMISDRIVFDEFPGGIIKEHHLPSNLAKGEIAQAIENLVVCTLKKLEITNGPAYFQIKIYDNTPFLIEVSPRLDGCHMWKLIQNYCGTDLLDATWQHLVNNVALPLKDKCIFPEKKLKFICSIPNTIFQRSFYTNTPVKDLCWYYETGDFVKHLNGYMEKCGYYITD